jgi:hypothetical protein
LLHVNAIDPGNTLLAVLAFTLAAIALELPFITTLLLIVRSDGRRPQSFQLGASGVAAAS